MIRWVLHCARCNGVLVHSEIAEIDLLGFDSYTNLVKPRFPEGGLRVHCATCNDSAIYQRHQLIYQKC
jgi:hypothetical protein